MVAKGMSVLVLKVRFRASNFFYIYVRKSRIRTFTSTNIFVHLVKYRVYVHLPSLKMIYKKFSTHSNKQSVTPACDVIFKNKNYLQVAFFLNRHLKKTSGWCAVSTINHSAVQSSHKRAVGPPRRDFGPCWWRGAACGWAGGSLPRPPPAATPPWSRPHGTRTCCAGCSRLGSWWAPHRVHSRSSCSGTASVPSAWAASLRAPAALCWVAD